MGGMGCSVTTLSVWVCGLGARVGRCGAKGEVNEAFRDAASESLRGIVGYTDEPLVSTDFRGDPRSSIFDALSTMVLEGTLVKVLSWYDNEWGYSCRVADLCALISERGV